jgi:hypothetical protein
MGQMADRDPKPVESPTERLARFWERLRPARPADPEPADLDVATAKSAARLRRAPNAAKAMPWPHAPLEPTEAALLAKATRRYCPRERPLK